MKEELYSEFKSPSSKYRAKTFWSWNGKLEENELIRQIHIIKKMGFGGFFIHSRTGLKTQYLGEEWFKLVNRCADEAKNLGLETWLYDEDRWPSGTAGGLVTKEKRYRAKYIHLIIKDSESFEWTDKYISAFSCKLKGIKFYNCKRIYQNTSKENYKNKDIIAFTIEEAPKSNVYNGFTYVDTLNRKATDKFIELTHEKYKNCCSEKFGKTIKGIFTDEPHRGSAMDGFSLSFKDGGNYAPWTYNLFGEFKNNYGYDLIEKLPELFLRKAGYKVSKVKWQYIELLEKMFLDNFAKPINDWCKVNNLISTGHILHEDSLSAQTAMSGSVMRYYEYMDYPGVDILTQFNNNYWVVKQVESVANQLGKKLTLSELYAATGWEMKFEDYKAVGDWQALFGISLRCTHLSWYNMEGESKRDYPASILHQSTWWEEYHYIEDYFSRIALIMHHGRRICKVLVINPVESVWCQIYAGWSKNLCAQSEDVEKLESKYKKTFKWLVDAKIDFDYGDEDIISRHYRIEKDENGNASIVIGMAKYETILVAGMVTMRKSTYVILKKFTEKGGKVVFAGKAPEYLDCEKSDKILELAKYTTMISFNERSFIKCFKNSDFSDIKMNLKKTKDILYMEKEYNGDYYIMFLNVSRDKAYKNVEIKIKHSGFMENWDIRTGNIYYSNSSNENNEFDINLDFLPLEEKLLRITPERNLKLKEKKSYSIKRKNVLNDIVDYKLSEPNICVLDMAEYEIDNDKTKVQTEVLKIDRTIRKHYGLDIRSSEMIQPWYKNNIEEKVYGKIKLNFKFYIDSIPDNMQLIAEHPERFKIKVNEYEAKFIQNKWWVDICFKKSEINKEMLKVGENKVSVEADFMEDMNIEALYIIGNFGVRLDGNRKIITKLPDKLNLSDITKQGLPFYSGKIIYRFNFDKNINESERAFIKIDNFSGSCLKINDNSDSKIIAFRPYECDVTEILREKGYVDVELILNRKNTFGPLHQISVLAWCCAPDNFVTDGDKFSDSYCLLPAGILDKVYMCIKEER